MQMSMLQGVTESYVYASYVHKFCLHFVRNSIHIKTKRCVDKFFNTFSNHSILREVVVGKTCCQALHTQTQSSSFPPDPILPRTAKIVYVF